MPGAGAPTATAADADAAAAAAATDATAAAAAIATINLFFGFFFHILVYFRNLDASAVLDPALKNGFVFSHNYKKRHSCKPMLF